MPGIGREWERGREAGKKHANTVKQKNSREKQNQNNLRRENQNKNAVDSAANVVAQSIKNANAGRGSASSEKRNAANIFK